MAKIPQEIAQAEIDKWLDYKRVKPKKRERLKDSVEYLIDCICDGSLILDDKHHLIQTLTFPLKSDGKETVKELKYRPRIMVSEINTKMKGAKSPDGDTRLLLYAALLTSNSSAVLARLDTEDNSTAQHISAFFL